MQRQGTEACPKCNTFLSYFGREASSLSTEAALALYDSTHIETDLHSYIGSYDTDLNQPAMNVMILECEDRLSFDPNDTDALECLAKHYASLRQVTIAKQYALQLLAINKKYPIAHKVLADIYIYEKQYEQALPHLRYCLLRKKSVTEFERLGYCFLHLNHIPNALKAFIHAKKIAKSTDSKDRLDTIIETLTEDL